MKGSDNPFPSMLFAEQGSDPATPAAGTWRLFTKSGGIYLIDDAGTVTGPLAAGTGSGDVTWALIQAAQLVNEVMNFPSIEGADDAQPEWWEKSANCTLTEADVAGEGITETYARALKAVTTGNGEYGYQRYTYADQPRVKAGRKLSAIVAVWSVGSAAARIRLQSSVGSLGVSADTTAAAWTILKVEGVTLDGTYVDIRCEADTGTAYFVPLGINIGEKAVPLRPRGGRWVYPAPVGVKALTGLADENTWTDVDVTANSSPLAFRAKLSSNLLHTNATGWDLFYRRNGTADSVAVNGLSSANSTERKIAENDVLLDDGQIFEYCLDRWTGTSTLAEGNIFLIAYEAWE